MPLLPDWTEPAMYGLLGVAVAILFIGLRRKQLRYGLTWKQTAEAIYSLGKSKLLPRLTALSRHVLLQQRLARFPLGGTMHFLIYGGLLVLLIGTTLIFVEHDVLRATTIEYLRDGFYLFYEVSLDTFGLVLIAGILLGLLRRQIHSPPYLPRSRGHYTALNALLFLAVTGFLLEGMRLTLRPVDWAAYSYVGYGISRILERANGSNLETAYPYVWWSHAVVVFGLLATWPVTFFQHILVISMNVLASGAKDPTRISTPFNILAIAESEETEISVGIASIADLDWKHRINLDSCVNCGRCDAVCPAFAAGRNLAPRVLIQDMKAQLDVAAQDRLPFFDVIAEETVWACTNCGACVRECPAHVTHVDFILDLRRHLVSEGRLNEKQIAVLTNLERHGNPYGLPSHQRTRWMEGTEVPSIEDNLGFEYLYWVGCAAAYDQRVAKVARALVRILREAEVSFAVLGDREKCTGEIARRLGEEGRFQMLALENIEVLQSAGTKKIVTHCPHCYNVLKHEYPALGGEFEIVHHTQLMERLAAAGRLSPTPRQTFGKVTYHDPCNLSRINNIAEEPRKLLRSAGAELVEMGRIRDRTFCCGAGGANAWYNVGERERMSHIRMREADSTGAEMIATACPFCLNMLEDSAKLSSKRMTVQDIAEIVADSVQIGPQP